MGMLEFLGFSRLVKFVLSCVLLYTISQKLINSRVLFVIDNKICSFA